MSGKLRWSLPRLIGQRSAAMTAWSVWVPGCGRFAHNVSRGVEHGVGGYDAYGARVLSPKLWRSSHACTPIRHVQSGNRNISRWYACAVKANETHNRNEVPLQTECGVSYANVMHLRLLTRAVWNGALSGNDEDVCIDATCGRGSDTIYLARRAGERALVHALDIQEDAVLETRARVGEQAPVESGCARVNAVVKNHADFDGLEQVDDASVSVVAYNLGWYPAYGADRSIITQQHTTIQSLENAARVVKTGGVITITSYIGHEGGPEEYQAVYAWTEELNSREWSVAHLDYPNRPNSPSLFIVTRVGKA